MYVCGDIYAFSKLSWERDVRSNGNFLSLLKRFSATGGKMRRIIQRDSKPKTLNLEAGEENSREVPGGRKVGPWRCCTAHQV